jgi:beta-aspartyl-dipeptidase (metallo-type)
MFTLIKKAQVYSPARIGVCDVLIAGEKIAAIGGHLSLSANLDCREINGEGLFLVPGFVDSLVHISGGGGEGGFASRTPALKAEQAIAAGVTTLIGALGTDDITRRLEDLLACARALNASGLSAYALTGSYRVPVRTLTGSVRDDIVLIPDIIGVGEVAIADHRSSRPSVDALARIAADAHVGGMLSGKRGTVLIHMGDDPEGLALLESASDQYRIALYQWLPTHINRLRALLTQGTDWALRGGNVDLTTSTTPDFIAAGEVPAAMALAELLSAGVSIERISMSSDGQASLPLFDSNDRLMTSSVASVSSLCESMREAVQRYDIPLELALTSITKTPADNWGLKQKGRVHVGADADLLLLDPDTLIPLTTIARGKVYPTCNPIGESQ